uniref:Steroid 5 alpha-reductase 1 n=1 Tax=Gopherus evgoodei TaxID=1825980 RepID=A0A8C4VK99_9SAUR
PAPAAAHRLLPALPVPRRLLESLSYGLVAAAALFALLLRFVRMPYGRYSTRRFGCPVPARLAWALQELPALLVPVGLSLFSGAARVSEWPNRVLLALFIGHYAHRYQRGSLGRTLIFCIYNGYLQGRSLSNYAEYPSGWLKGPCFIVGELNKSMLGMTINIYSDHILRNLRKPGETGYKIPRGGLFEYVTGANFFGEILEWFGFALASCTIESAAFAICTFFILGSRAHQHHQNIYRIDFIVVFWTLYVAC